MRLCAYDADGVPTAGVAVGDTVYDLRSVTDLPDDGTGDPLKHLLASGAWRDLAERLAGVDVAGTGRPVGTLRELELLPPVRPDKFICIGLNYRSHAEEAGMEIPSVPAFFVKLPNALAGHNQPVPIPTVTHRIDWEGEVAVVVGRRASHVSEDEALDHLAGYTVVNDVSARDYQFKTSQWILGKTFDRFGPVGPVIATPDELPDPTVVTLTTRVNGETKQQGATDDFVFPLPYLIAFLSTIMTLEPGDIIATGSPSGIGALQKPRQWLRDGDRVDITVPGVGTLSNVFRSST